MPTLLPETLLPETQLPETQLPETQLPETQLPELMTVTEAASWLQIAYGTVHAAISEGRLPFETVHGRKMLRREALLEYQKRTQPDGSKTRGRPRNLSIDERELINGAELTPDEVNRAQLFRRLNDHDKQMLDRIMRGLAVLNRDHMRYKFDIVLNVLPKEGEGLGGIHVIEGRQVHTQVSDENLAVVTKLMGEISGLSALMEAIEGGSGK